jgi:ATP/maltotriose-dependent transcriptional regulator MalT
MAIGGSVLRAKLRVPRVKALPRERLDQLLTKVWNHRLGLVVAPAGSGKTTLLAQFALAANVPVAWYRAEPADSSAQAVVAHLERAMVAALGVKGGWSSIDDAIDAVDGWGGERALIAVDDLHALWGTEAEETLERLLGHLPPGVVMLAATRRAPGFNLSRLRVSDDLVEMGPEELRFRSWEVERLFHDFYNEPLRPDELAELARRTEGWAAGLQLFHLATRGKPAAERRRVLQELAARSRLTREYLARNVLDELPLHVRDFLLQTCVLGRLTPALCDELTGATSSEALLAELEQRQIFTASLDDEGSYRYHEVLRTHLEAALLETAGEDEARARYLRAGQLLESHGHLPEALRAYCRAEAWAAATGLLGGRGEQVIDRPGDWIEALPPALLEHDPWLLLGSARRNLALGRWDAALDAYRRAEAASGPGQPAESSRRERLAIEAWMQPAVPSPTDWTDILRLAVVRDPVGLVHREAARLGGAEGALVGGLAALLAGDVRNAVVLLDEAGGRADASRAIALGASLAAAIARTLAGETVGPSLGPLYEEADQAGLPWLAGLAQLVGAMEPAGSSGGEALASVVAKDDGWGLPLAQLCSGIGILRDGRDASDALADAADGFAGVGAPVLEAWARSARALCLAQSGDPRALADARRATIAARAASLPGPLAIAAAAAALADPDVEAAHHHRTLARGLTLETGLSFLTVLTAESRQIWRDSAVKTVTGLRVRCFGPLVAELDGEVLDLSPIKPRVRSLLRLLALSAGKPVHRDRIVDVLWPAENDQKLGTRNLQVAISSLRQLLEPGVARGAATIIVREGDTYRLDVGPDAVDLVRFDRAVNAAKAARASGDNPAAIADLGAALDLYDADVLADEGAAEWVLGERDRYRLAAADASQARAELLLGEGDAAGAATEADRGLRIDHYRDALWRLLVQANEQAGEPAAARKAKERYDAVLRELGVNPSS